MMDLQEVRTIESKPASKRTVADWKALLHKEEETSSLYRQALKAQLVNPTRPDDSWTVYREDLNLTLELELRCSTRSFGGLVITTWIDDSSGYSTIEDMEVIKLDDYLQLVHCPTYPFATELKPVIYKFLETRARLLKYE